MSSATVMAMSTPATLEDARQIAPDYGLVTEADFAALQVKVAERVKEFLAQGIEAVPVPITASEFRAWLQTSGEAAQAMPLHSQRATYAAMKLNGILDSTLVTPLKTDKQ